MHTEALADDDWPAGHGEHADRPGEAPKDPAVHAVHVDRPLLEATVPGVHAEQPTDPFKDAILPAEQCLYTVWAVASV